jgi:hypothetical protein
MANFELNLDDKAVDEKGNKTVELDDPLAYVFIGRDKFRSKGNGGTRTPQEWRKLFMALARMAKVKQNTFGLTIIYDALEEMVAPYSKGPSKAKFDARIKELFAQIDKEDSDALVQRKAKMAKKAETKAAK